MPREVVSCLARKPLPIAALKKQQEELLKKLKEAKAKELQAINKDIKRKTEIAGALALKEFEKNPEGAFATTLLGLNQ